MFEQPGADAGGGNAGLMYNQLKKFIGVVVSNQSNKLCKCNRHVASHLICSKIRVLLQNSAFYQI